MLAIVGMTVFGLLRYAFGHLPDVESAQLHDPRRGQRAGGVHRDRRGFLLLRTFSSGCAALTGVEAISNGVPAFKKPKSKNAATTLLLMGSIAVTMLMGILALGNLTHLRFAEFPATQLLRDGVPVGDTYTQHTVISQLAKAVYGGFAPAFYLTVAFTGVILVLAANTAFNGFPVLGSILAQRRLPAAPAAHPRRPAGLQQRHRPARRLRGGADPGVRRQGHPAHPALHRRASSSPSR